MKIDQSVDVALFVAALQNDPSQVQVSHWLETPTSSSRSARPITSRTVLTETSSASEALPRDYLTAFVLPEPRVESDCQSLVLLSIRN